MVINPKHYSIKGEMVRFYLSFFGILCLTNLPGQIKTGYTAVKGMSDSLSYRVEPAPEWTGLFYRKSGWFGGDGIFSIPLDGRDVYDPAREVLFIFSDTYVGEVVDNKPVGDTMVNNSTAIFKGATAGPENMTFVINKDASGHPVSFFQPKDAAENGTYFWLGDGFVNRELEGKMYIFAYHIRKTGENVFDFEEVDVSILVLPPESRPPFKKYDIIETPFHLDLPSIGSGSLGAGIFVNTSWSGAAFPDGYIYIYGCIGQEKNLVAARVKAGDFEKIEQWEYYTGTKWSQNIGDINAITNSVSNELSLTPLNDGRYLLTFQVLGISDKVGIRIATTPVGPFSEIQEIYRTPEIDENLLPYNAKAHPAISRPGELLISYNTITFDFWNDIKKDAHIYRPRFIRLILDTE
ncbi:MAG: DUF4185 domain-containing protein [Saprospiraceae bacterium]|nr:DUF4185 domain-containing protein [Saprospiraceae bacterium]